MNIISNFIDFYDNSQSILQSPLPVNFYRTTTGLSLDLISIRVPSFRSRKLVPFVIGFCGKAYPGVKIDNQVCSYTITGSVYLSSRQEIVLTEQEINYLMKFFSADFSYQFQSNIPYFVLTQDKLIGMPVLSEFEFYKTMNPTVCYEKLADHVKLNGSCIEYQR